MNTILVTGGSGVLGRALLPTLEGRADVRVLSRHADPRPTYRQGDLSSGAGLADALRGVSTVIHAASQPSRPQADVDMTGVLLAAAREAGVRHLVYVSIVGCDQVRAFPYYRAKTQVEALIAGSGVPCTVVRATQFHEFVAFMLSRLTRAPLLPLPGLPLQPVDVYAAAQQIAQVALGAPQGRAPDIVGPQVLPLPELARTWADATGARTRVLAVPAARRFTPLTRSDLSGVGRTWAEWLAQEATRPNPYAG
ncbi:SDR family oxidoreductase [Deinococcus radiotolerans]|uniref:Nucleotide-diphosphate-sugar epimerase n=1 Tax=Deinococcus radiotolerans TaxID=1309407 RepID=A0ABQ2FGS5_9DEIO|nr:NAD(P)H-binding protein [Deinococcus radiotolerans]GGK96979.1 nucleotide-diphosphate-sugar epimerase [Deinococcus radiotolerans]